VNKSPSVKTQVKESSPSGKGRRQSSAEERAALRPLQKALQKTERELEGLQSKLASLQAELLLPGLYDEGARDKLAELVKSEGALKVQIATVEETWMEQQEALESASPHSG
jgi:ATP-binding cassette subfamily F protein 3